MHFHPPGCLAFHKGSGLEPRSQQCRHSNLDDYGSRNLGLDLAGFRERSNDLQWWVTQVGHGLGPMPPDVWGRGRGPGKEDLVDDLSDDSVWHGGGRRPLPGRAARPAAGLRALTAHSTPAAVTEFGCTTYRDTGDSGRATLSSNGTTAPVPCGSPAPSSATSRNRPAT